MVLLAAVMTFPLLKGLLNVISAYINLLIFLCIFFFRKPEAMAVMGVASVVVAHSILGYPMFHCLFAVVAILNRENVPGFYFQVLKEMHMSF